MKTIGAISTVILVVLLLIATHAYVAFQFFYSGHAVGVEETLDYSIAVCTKGEALLIGADGSRYYCQKGRRS